MTLATFEADGSGPSRLERLACALRRWPVQHPMIIVAAVLAVAVAIGEALTAPAKATVRTTFIPTSITAESLAGPPLAMGGAPDSKPMLPSLLTEAGLKPDFALKRLSWDQARRLNALLPEAKVAIQAPQPFVLPTSTKDGRAALHCLTQAAYYEAGASGSDAEAAVAQVVLNRVRHPAFPKSVCGVVYQGADRDTGCQFTFTCDGALARPLDKAAWDEAGKVAARALSGYVVKAVGASTYYHADYVFPAWAPTLEKITTVGPHIFYSMAGSEGSLLTGRYAGGELKLAKVILKAADRFLQKPDNAADRVAPAPAPVEVAGLQTPGTVAPAGLKVQADRLQRVHEAFAVSRGGDAKAAEPAKVETAAAPAADAPAAPAPPVQTADAQGPAA